MLLVRGEPFTFYCGEGGSRIVGRKSLHRKVKIHSSYFLMRRMTILHNYFFMNEGGLLSRHVVIGKVLPSVPSKDNVEGYISRNEMSSDYVNVSFFKWKGFHGTFIEQGKVCTSQRTLQMKQTFRDITFSITGARPSFSLLYNRLRQ